jgi:hypothetical protein
MSITTDVSRSPRPGSGIEGLIHHRIEIGPEATCVDPRPSFGPRGDRGPVYESSWLDRPKLGNRCAIAGDDHGLPGLDVA